MFINFIVIFQSRHFESTPLESYTRAEVNGYREQRVNGMNGNTDGVNGHSEVRLNGHSHSPEANGDRDPIDYPTTPPPPFPPIGRKRDIYRDVTVFEQVDQTAISVSIEVSERKGFAGYEKTAFFVGSPV